MGVNEVALGLTLGIAAYTDWRKQKIYNKLLVPAFFTALLLHTYQGGISELMNSLLGAALGFALLLVPYLLGGMGAGDVKLLAVIGAFGGVAFVFSSLLYGAVIGGLISALLLVRRRSLGVTLKHLLLFSSILGKHQNNNDALNNAKQEKFPYGIALALGALIELLVSQRG